MLRAALCVELMLLVAGCRGPAPVEKRASASATWQAALAPRRSSGFECKSGSCRQEHPRLPDSAEWVCAERDGVVWCRSGEPAAGVAPGSIDAHFRCGPRWNTPSERVCIDERPEYPAGRYACRFEQESGMARVCQPSSAASSQPRVNALPACWFDKDCRSGACDRGACACREQRDCERGACREGLCVEAKP